MARGSKRAGRRELSVGYVFLVWGVFFLLWAVAGFIIAAIVFAVMIAAGVGAFRLR
jgi:Flp pilus assembly protein TadB